jgi:ATP phosphoribosyltransferase
VETVLADSARLIVNRVALKLHAERLRRLIGALRDAAAHPAA